MRKKFVQRECAFTLIELLVVILIIGIISAIAVPKILNAYYQAKDKKTMTDMRNIAVALGIYRIDAGTLPNTTDPAELVDILKSYNGKGNELTALSDHDAWRHPFYYRRMSDDGYTLKSFGRDGGVSTPATVMNFNPDADIVLIRGIFVASHEGTTVVVGQ